MLGSMQDYSETIDPRMTSPIVPRLNLIKAGLLGSGSQRRLKSKGSLTLSRATLSEHQRKMSLKYKQAYHEELLERQMSLQGSPHLSHSKHSSFPSKQELQESHQFDRMHSMKIQSHVKEALQEPKAKKSAFSEKQSQKEEKEGEFMESRFSEKPTMKIGNEQGAKQEEEKEGQKEIKDLAVTQLLGDALLLKNKGTVSSIGQFSIGQSSDEQKPSSLKEQKINIPPLPDMSKSQQPTGISSLFQKLDKSEASQEKQKQFKHDASPIQGPKKQISGLSLGSFIQKKLDGLDGNSPFKLLEVVMNKSVVQNLIDALIASLDDKFALRKKYVEFTKVLYSGFSILFQKKEDNLHILYWLLDCKQEEFIIELGKMYRVFDTKHRGVLSKESFEAWLRQFIKETSPSTVADIFRLYDDEKGEKRRNKLVKKNERVASEEVISNICHQYFKAGSSYVKFTEIVPFFILYFLTRILLKIKRRKALFNTVLFGDHGRDQRGLNSIIRQAIGASNVVQIRILERLIMDFYKVKTELTSNNLYALINSLKKNVQQNQLDVVQGSMLVYGDPTQPNIRHISSWLPFNIAMQLIASELDQCQDTNTFLSSYGIIQEEKYLESAVFSVTIDDQIIRMTILREMKQYINSIQLKELAKEKPSRSNSKIKSFALLRSKTRKEASARQKLPYDHIVKIVLNCYPKQLQFFSGQIVDGMIFNYFYSLLYKTTVLDEHDRLDDFQIDTNQIIDSQYAQNQVKTLALTLPLFAGLLYLEEIQLKLYKGTKIEHPFYPSDYAYPEEEESEGTIEEHPTLEEQSLDKSAENSRTPHQRMSLLNTGSVDQMNETGTRKEMSETSKTMKSRKTKHKGKKDKKKNLMKAYIFLNKYFDEYQMKLMKEYQRKKREKAKVQEVKQQAGLDSSRLEVRTPTHMPHFKMKDNTKGRSLIRPQKFLHEKVENLQGAMRQAWNDQRLKDQVKIKKLEQASKQLVFKWTRKGEHNIAEAIKNQGKTNASITFGPKPTPVEKKRMDCSCAIF